MFFPYMETLFIEHFLFALYIWAILRFFGGKHLGGSSVGPEINLELRESMDLALFFLNALISCPERFQSIWGCQLIFEKSYRNSKVRFSNSKIDQNRDFLKFGQRPLE